ncbi:hypothetical protein HU200_014837 [Digitaria exilis]|uniref:GDSL esterase/lipase n=1 Tax=Digitaria exilis TaxID=1010633 RepID=A0A835FB49_9POAL|nr:hypothetical protein HU200_014837 [Digitaria exilis]
MEPIVVADVPRILSYILIILRRRFSVRWARKRIADSDGGHDKREACAMDGSSTRAAVSLLLLLLLLSPPPSSPSIRRYHYDSIFSFGDSYTDTGNNPVAFAWYSVLNPVTRPPYGTTFFGRPTGRLTVDFLGACGLGLPLVPPFLAHDGSFRHGANFAVAIDAGFFHDGEPPGSGKFPLNTSLGVQMQWFESLLPSLCATTQDCKEFLGRSVFFIGELGFNDYSFSLFRGKSVQQLISLVPDIINTISIAIEVLIRHGATSLLVSGMVPAGCEPPVLVFCDGADPASYSPRTGYCVKEMNELSIHHNSMLQESLAKIRADHPDVDITYADFFSPIMAMIESPAKFVLWSTIVCIEFVIRAWFDEDDALTVPLQHSEITCGDPGCTTWKDPSARLFWDGAHLTEAANRYVADGWLTSLSSPATATN